MMGRDDWYTQNTDDVHDPQRNGLICLAQFPREKQREMMTSPLWTRAIFIRDPIKRLISAYSEKVLKEFPDRPAGNYFKESCCGPQPSAHVSNQCDTLMPYNDPVTEDILPFSDFVKEFMIHCNDVHWRSQSSRMTEASWKTINLVGEFGNLHAHKLLKKIGAFDELVLRDGFRQKVLYSKQIS